MPKRTALRVGLLVDSPKLNYDLARLVIESKADTSIEISAVLILDPHHPRSTINSSWIFGDKNISQLRLKFRRVAYSGMVMIERLLFYKSGVVSLHQTHVDLIDSDIRKIVLCGEIARDANAIRIYDDQVLDVRALDLDLLIRGTSKFLTGGILNSSNLGVIGLHHGDNNHFRGRPSGFWECYEEERSTSFVIQKLGEKLDQGDILVVGSINTCKLVSENFLRLHAEAADALLLFVRRLAKDGVLPEPLRIMSSTAAARRHPSLKILISYVAQKWLGK